MGESYRRMWCTVKGKPQKKPRHGRGECFVQDTSHVTLCESCFGPMEGGMLGCGVPCSASLGIHLEINRKEHPKAGSISQKEVRSYKWVTGGGISTTLSNDTKANVSHHGTLRGKAQEPQAWRSGGNEKWNGPKLVASFSRSPSSALFPILFWGRVPLN